MLGTFPRKVILVLASIGLMFLSSCGSVRAPDPEDGRPYVLTTFTVLADMTRTIAQDHVVVESIIEPDVEVHSYGPTPRDIAKAHTADLVLHNGLGMEAWLTKFLTQSDAPHRVVSEGVTAIPITAQSSEGAANPHAWMSPVDAEIYVDNIVTALSEVLPEKETEFEQNGEAYKADIRRIHAELKDALTPIPANKRVLVTCEGAFSYLARDAGLTEKFLWPVNSEQQATPQHVGNVIEYVKAHDVPAVFCESTVSDKAMRQVVAETNTKFGGTLYVDSLSTPDGPVDTYLGLLRHNADTIVTALQQDSQ